MTTTSAASTPPPLLDLHGLLAGIRWRRRMWLAIGLLGLLAGGLLAVLVPPQPTAVARLLIAHETEASDSGQMETDVALLETTRIAAAALDRIDAPLRPEQFLGSYRGEGLTASVLELRVTGPSNRDAVVRAQALADAFIADHIRRAEATANADARSLIERRDRAEAELGEVDAAIAATGATGAGPDVDELYNRRAALTAQVRDLGQRAQESATGAPRVAAGTRIVDAPRAVTESVLATGVKNGVLGLVLGLGAGLALAAVASVVADRPVLRRDIAGALGASVIAQLPAPRLGPARLWRRSRGVSERARVAATLARAVGDDPVAVSLLELGCPRTAATLARDVAGGLAADGPVVIVDALPGSHLDETAATTGSQVRVLDVADLPAVAPDTPPRPQRHLGVGSVSPGAAWTDLERLGSETLLVVRAGYADTAWLHTVGRQLADARIAVIGVVLVHPDPRDRSDGTLWDGLHTALRGRAARRAEPEPATPDREQSRPNGNGHGHVPAGSTTPTTPTTPTGTTGTAVAPRRATALTPLFIPERRFGRDTAPAGPQADGTGSRSDNPPESSPENEPTHEEVS